MVLLLAAGAWAAAPESTKGAVFPWDLQSYSDGQADNILSVLIGRVRQEPFNLVATLIFFAAIVHTFLTGRFMAIAHRWTHGHEQRIRSGSAPPGSVHHGAELFHFLGEVEAVFGIWAVALFGAIVVFFDARTAGDYIVHRVNFTEAIFVVVIMTLAATRPILQLSETIMRKVAGVLGGSLSAWWWSVLTLGPILGSLITEPAAMTISALLLSDKFYEMSPSGKFRYATLGLLFVNISVGGTLTSFAAPPVLMVAAPWKWDTVFMMTHFGWKAVLGILSANLIYYLAFRSELNRMQAAFALRSLKDDIHRNFITREGLETQLDRHIDEMGDRIDIVNTLDDRLKEFDERLKARLQKQVLEELEEKGISRDLAGQAFQERYEELRLRRMRRAVPALLPEEQRPPFFDPDWDRRDDPVPVWVTVVHILFMGWTIANAHYPALFVPGLLFFLGFAQVTAPYQNRINLKPPLLVGFFLGGLVIHGGVQAWWIAPILSSLSEIPLMLGATILTAFNDNAAITFLSTLVPGFTDGLKYAVVAGAVAGGGLTVIANAPNPAGLSLLKQHFNDEVSPASLFLAAVVPTIVVWTAFWIL
ncbi:MAG: putative Na+/H+ antiporter [Desulfobacterales bacterium]